MTVVTVNSPVFLLRLFLKFRVNPAVKLSRGFDEATARSENFNRALMLNAVSQCHNAGTKATVAASVSSCLVFRRGGGLEYCPALV